MAPHESTSAFARNHTQAVELSCGKVVVKRFGRPTNARRSFDAAVRLSTAGVGTPQPIASLESGPEGAATEGYLVTRHVEASSLHEELLELFWGNPRYRQILDLLDVVAAAVRAMHDAGVVHGDLGNQNILVRRTEDESGVPSWSDVSFLDLERSRLRDSVADKERGFDLSRLMLPSRLRRMFQQMYYRERCDAGQPPPAELARWERRYRRRFTWHGRTRWVRHPFRSLRHRRHKRGQRRYPKPREYWIWDDHRAEAAGVLLKGDKLWHGAWLSAIGMSLVTAIAIVPVWIAWKLRRRRMYRSPVPMKGRFGVAIEPFPGTEDRLLTLLGNLGPVPVLVRFHFHEGEERRALAAALARRLHETGHSVSINVVQNRRAVTDAAAWSAYCEKVLAETAEFVDLVEIGHAVNRVKWGTWTLSDVARLARPFRKLRKKYKGLRLVGPAVNDFEYHWILAAAARLPFGLRWHALSLHLHVDRAGAPEGVQRTGVLKFSGPDKFVLARVLAGLARRCGPRVVVTEVNWPLGEEGGRSHEFAPFVWAADTHLDTTAPEDQVADYLVRYYLHALCGGMIERVYWWKLIGQSFGLVDDKLGDRWQPRPSYRAFRTLVRMIGTATFQERLPSPPHVYFFGFDNGVTVGFTTGEEWTGDLPVTPRAVYDRDGNRLGDFRLNGRPCYLVERE